MPSFAAIWTLLLLLFLLSFFSAIGHGVLQKKRTNFMKQTNGNQVSCVSCFASLLRSVLCPHLIQHSIKNFFPSLNFAHKSHRELQKTRAMKIFRFSRVEDEDEQKREHRSVNDSLACSGKWTSCRIELLYGRSTKKAKAKREMEDWGWLWSKALAHISFGSPDPKKGGKQISAFRFRASQKWNRNSLFLARSMRRLSAFTTSTSCRRRITVILADHPQCHVCRRLMHLLLVFAVKREQQTERR